MMNFHHDGGDPARPSLLLVHGMLTDARHWLPNLETLGHHFNLVRVDLPGHGSSPAPADPSLIGIDTLIARLEEIRRELGLERWHICGQSFGGGLVLAYALRHPDRIVSQTFTNARTPLRAPDAPDAIADRAARLAALHREGHEALRREVFHPANARRFPADLRQVLVNAASAIDMGCYIRLVEHVVPALSLHPLADNPPKVPTLLINGRHERAFQPSRDLLPMVWPSVRIVDLDGGHSVNIENPDGFADALVRFVEALENPCHAELS